MRLISYRALPSIALERQRTCWSEAVLLNDLVIDLAVADTLAGNAFIGGNGFNQDSRRFAQAEIQKILDTVANKCGIDLTSSPPLVDDNVMDSMARYDHLLKWKLDEVTFGTPVTRPTSLRDFYAFEQHVKTANANRGRDVPKEWYEMPVFYFSNHTAIYGPDDNIPYPSYSDALDYELEVACVIGMEGRNIPEEKAEEHIFGYMIFNDWSARDEQRREMAVGLGPAKGKDFANSFGPYLVTPDELADRHTGRPGVYDLEMVARVNGKEMSRGNWKDLYWSFGDMIARASQDVTLAPGDVIGSGTVGTGCLLELTKGQGPWLQPGDVVELEIERLGVLRNTVGEKKRT